MEECKKVKQIEVEQYDCDAVADLLWWVKGYVEAHETLGRETSINRGHINSLEHILNQVKKVAVDYSKSNQKPLF